MAKLAIKAQNVQFCTNPMAKRPSWSMGVKRCEVQTEKKSIHTYCIFCMSIMYEYINMDIGRCHHMVMY
jgi:hypothetical protein